jgi:hypothetical protein
MGQGGGWGSCSGGGGSGKYTVCSSKKKPATVCRYIKIKRIGGRHRSKKLCEIMAEIKMPRLSDLSPNIWLRSDIYST